MTASFLEVDPGADLSRVVRPRSQPLLTSVPTDRGVRHVWMTFSADQVDLDYHNPDVLLEMIGVLLFYLQRGARLIRLDAIAYLWKELGTSCIHLRPTHVVVKLLRDLVDAVARHAADHRDECAARRERQLFRRRRRGPSGLPVQPAAVTAGGVCQRRRDGLVRLARAVGTGTPGDHVSQFHGVPRWHRRSSAGRFVARRADRAARRRRASTRRVGEHKTPCQRRGCRPTN